MSFESRPSPRRRPTRRQALLAEAQLTWAPREQQRAYWARRNRRRPTGQRLGDVAKAVLAGPGLRASLRLTRLRRQWEQTVPESLRAHSEVMSLRGGRLLVMVDDPSIRFVLEREIGQALLAAIRASDGGAAVREIEYRLGAIDRSDGDQPGTYHPDDDLPS